MTPRATEAVATIETALGYLEKLAIRLGDDGLRVELAAQAGALPHLHVANPATQILSEHVVAAPSRDGSWWFWWSWAERIARIDDLDAASARVGGVLAATAD